MTLERVDGRRQRKHYLITLNKHTTLIFDMCVNPAAYISGSLSYLYRLFSASGD